MAEILINDIEPINQYTAAGGETSYDYDFPIFDADDLVVLEITTAGVVNILIRGTDYTISGVGLADGGTMTFDLTAYPSGATASYRYVLYRDLAVARGTDFLTGGDFKASTMNRELDKIIMMIQQNELELKRSLSLKKADAEDELKFAIQTATERGGKLVAFNSAGNEVEGVTPASVALSTIDTLFANLASGDFMYQDGINWVNKTTAEIKTILGLVLNNFAGTAAPTVNEDSGEGYSIGSQWYDGANDNMYHCLDATVGAAVWVQGDIVADDLGSAALATLIDDDSFATATASNVPSSESVKALVDAQGTTERFQGPASSLSAAALITQAHSLGAVPDVVYTHLVCTTTDAGFAVGDILRYFQDAGENATNVGLSIYYDATNVNVRVTNSTVLGYVPHKTTGTRTALLAANWDLVITALYFT